MTFRSAGLIRDCDAPRLIDVTMRDRRREGRGLSLCSFHFVIDCLTTIDAYVYGGALIKT